MTSPLPDLKKARQYIFDSAQLGVFAGVLSDVNLSRSASDTDVISSPAQPIDVTSLHFKQAPGFDGAGRHHHHRLSEKDQGRHRRNNR